MEVEKYKSFTNSDKKILKLGEELKSKKRFYISDMHFGDERLNLYGRDLMFKDSKECDDYIIDTWNKTISKNDQVIVIGDISMTKDGLKKISKLNGEKILVKGNYEISEKEGGTAKYDVDDKLLLNYFTKVVTELYVKVNGEDIYVNHFPTNARQDMFNIVGHIHGTWKVQRNMINVGCDAWHFTPVSEDLIKFQINGIRNHYDQNVYAGELLANIKYKKANLKLLRAPMYNNIATFEENQDIVIFLMGPIQGAPDWQTKFYNTFEKKIKEKDFFKKLNKSIIVACPRRENLNDSKFVYQEQVDWESFYLQKAANNGVIFCWLPKMESDIKGRSYAQTSRFEIGEWWSKGKLIKNFKMIIGADKNFDGLKYIEYKFKQEYNDFKIENNFNDSIDEIIEYISTK